MFMFCVMGLPDVVELARNFAVMVRVHGPDPKGLKMRKHAFHQYNSGSTTLSASGMLLSRTLYDADAVKKISGDGGGNMVLVVTSASVVEPFLSPKSREAIIQGKPELIPGAQIDVMLEDKLKLENSTEGDVDKGASHWVTGQLLRMVDIPESSLAIQTLVEASSGPVDQEWEVGWSLASNDTVPQSFMDTKQTEQSHATLMENKRHPGLLGMLSTRIAILGVPVNLKEMPNIDVMTSNRRGNFLLAVGSPFGVLSPMHFSNSLSVGSISNCYPPRSSDIQLVMADIRCLPGMEGGPVFDEHACIIGILIRPLRQKSTGAEIQLVIPWEAIANACSDLLIKEPQNAGQQVHIDGGNLKSLGDEWSHESDGPKNDEFHNSYLPSPLPVEKAAASICLITVDEGVWASGILLNDQGLILTNAHLLEPWRFGKAKGNGGRNGMKSGELFFSREDSAVLCPRRFQTLPVNPLNLQDTSVTDKTKENRLNLSYRSRRNIRVRLDHLGPWIWCGANVMYVCKGPLDVALLQLDNVADQLCPIKVDFSCPGLGSKAFVIGHGLFGPRCGLSPSICSGVVAKVVKAKAPPYLDTVMDSNIPAMLETTAAVHPGGSGGAVVNSEGHMIGLVTSNARHGGGMVIPHLNFSIPCAVLAPVFEFARDMKDVSLLQKLDKPNEHLSSVWALVPPLSPKPSPPFPSLPQPLMKDKDESGKGSKFAKFIAEREKMFRRSTQLGKMDGISNELLPSKL